MSETKFTKGPWTAHYCVDTMTSQVTAPICETEATGEIAWIGEQSFKRDAEANARLIAAAPEMYEALKSLALYIEGLPELTVGDQGEDWGTERSMHEWHAKEVLAKARGES